MSPKSKLIGKTVNGLKVYVSSTGIDIVDDDLGLALDLDESLELSAMLIRGVLEADKKRLGA